MNFLIVNILILISLLSSLILFDFIVYYKICFLEGGNAEQFIMSKRRNIAPHSGIKSEYLFLLMGALSAVGANIALYDYFINTPYRYLFIFPPAIIAIIASFADYRKISAITTPNVQLWKFRINLNPPFGLKGSIIIWSGNGLPEVAYKYLFKLVKCCLILFLFSGLYSFLDTSK